jgi:hypothetical protein
MAMAHAMGRGGWGSGELRMPQNPYPDRRVPRTDQPCTGVDWSCSDRWARKLRDGTNVYQSLWYAWSIEGRACIEIQIDRFPEPERLADIADAIIADVLDPRSSNVHIAWGPYPWQLGKWNNRSVPSRGWTCEGLNDVGHKLTNCEMCESAQVRYVHVMSHRGWPEKLRVWGDCADLMKEEELRWEDEKEEANAPTHV